MNTGLVSKAQRSAAWAGLLLVSSTVIAGIPPSTLTFDPASPRAHQVVTMTHHLGSCGDTFPGYSPTHRVVEVSGTTVRVTVDYQHSICIPSQPFQPTYAWTLGMLPAGTYTVELIADGGDAPSTFVLATGDLVVAPGLVAAPSPTTVPGLNGWGLGVLVGLTLAGAGLLLGRKP